MSAENKAVVRRLFEDVWNNRNLNILDELFSPSYTDHDPNTPDLGKGPEAIRRKVNIYTTAFPDARMTVEEMIAEEDYVVTRWSARGTHKGELQGIAPTGRQVNVSGTTTSRLSGGKIVENYDNWDALGLMQQLGAVPKLGRAAGGGR